MAALMLVPSLFKENQEWLFMFGDVRIYFWMLFLYRCMLCAMLSFFKQYFCFVCINRVLFFIKILSETTGICLVLYFQMISNLAEALYLICMFIILQQIVQPSIFYGIGRSGNKTSGVQGHSHTYGQKINVSRRCDIADGCLLCVWDLLSL